MLAEYTSLNREIANFPLVAQTSYEGNLECVAKAQNNSNIEPTVSYTHYLKVVGESLYYQVNIVYHTVTHSNIEQYVCITMRDTLLKGRVIVRCKVCIFSEMDE